MIEPTELGNFFAVFFSSALVIVLSYLSYGGLVVSTAVLASTANLLNHAFWVSVIVLMLIGYFFAPLAIWHLCVATHEPEFASPTESSINH